MSSRLLKQENDLTAQTDPEKTDLMIRDLIRQVKDTVTPSSLSDSEESGVLIDTTMEGVRCLLIRLRSQSQSEVIAQIVLSPREEEIARMVAAGYPNKTIAAVLDISSWTVGTYLRRVFAKLGVGSRAAMVARLLEKGGLRLPTKKRG